MNECRRWNIFNPETWLNVLKGSLVHLNGSCFRIFAFWLILLSKYNNHWGKWCGILAVSKFQASSYESYFGFFVNIIMKSSCVCSCGKQHDYHPPPLDFAPFSTRFLISFQYGGLQKTISLSRFCFNQSSSFVKYLSHLWFSSVAQGSSVNLNSSFNLSKNVWGVARKSVLLENNQLLIIYKLARNKIKTRNDNAPIIKNAIWIIAQVSSSLNNLYFACKNMIHKWTRKYTISVQITHKIIVIFF